MEQRVVPLPFTSCAMSPGMTSQARSISCQTTLRKTLSTKNCSLFRSFSRRTKPKSELESTTSKYSGPLTKHERVCRRPTGIWKHYEKSCPTRKRKQSLGGDLWNSGQPSFAASVSSQLSRDKATVTCASKFLAWRGTTSFRPGFEPGTVGTIFLGRVDERNDSEGLRRLALGPTSQKGRYGGIESKTNSEQLYRGTSHKT